MDPYFKPILVSGAVVILLNTVFILPFAWSPILSYLIGGSLAAYMFREALVKKQGAFAEVKISDVLILGLGVGIFAGGLIALVVALKLQEPQTKQFVVNAINEAMKMKSTQEFERVSEIGPVFLIVMAMVTMAITSLGAIFGALAALPLLNPKRK